MPTKTKTKTKTLSSTKQWCGPWGVVTDDRDPLLLASEVLASR